MKRIYLITDERPFWAEIKELLTRVNAEVVTLSKEAAREISTAEKPDLIIMDAQSHRAISSLVQQLPRLIIKAGIPAGTRFEDSSGGNLHIIGWPMEEEVFLDLTSRLLSISERRVFKALIGIIPKGGNTRYIGKSEDFSHTGLAFTVDHPLEVGQEVTISFFAAEVMKSVKLKAEVVRRTTRHSDGKTSYGARFVNPDTESRNILGKFILGKA